MKNIKPTFLKRRKPKQKIEMKQVDQKWMNRLFLGGLIAIVVLATLSIIVSLTRSNKPQTIIQEVSKDTTTTDYHLQYYLNDYVKAYFNLSEDNAIQLDEIEKLNSFYDSVPETRNQGHTKSPSSLVSARLLSIKDNTATYQVTYSVGKGDDVKEITTGFAIPFGVKENQYYISGLPWFIPLTEQQATGFATQDKLKLIDDTETESEKKEDLDSFLNLFFTNYTTNQENLDLLAKDISALENTTYKSLDYSYYKSDGKKVIAFAQVTFEIAGNTHSENFTLSLQPKDESYFVQSLKHTISKNYTKTNTTKGDTK